MSRPVEYSKRFRHVGINLTRDAMANGALDSSRLVMESKGNSYSVRMRREVDVQMDHDDSDEEVPGKFMWFSDISVAARREVVIAA